MSKLWFNLCKYVLGFLFVRFGFVSLFIFLFIYLLFSIFVMNYYDCQHRTYGERKYKLAVMEIDLRLIAYERDSFPLLSKNAWSRWLGPLGVHSYPNRCPANGVTKAIVCLIWSLEWRVLKTHILHGMLVAGFSLSSCASARMNIWHQRKEGNILFNDALNTFYLRLYGVGHMVKDHSDSERGNPLPHRLLFPISSKGSFICIIPQTW